VTTIYNREEALKLHQREFEEEIKTFAGRRRLIEKYDIRDESQHIVDTFADDF